MPFRDLEDHLAAISRHLIQNLFFLREAQSDRKLAPRLLRSLSALADSFYAAKGQFGIQKTIQLIQTQIRDSVAAAPASSENDSDDDEID
jgi:hypothetical protein